MRITTLLFFILLTITVSGQSKKVLDNVLTVAVYNNSKNYIPLGYGNADLCEAARKFKSTVGASEIGTGFIYRYKNIPYLVTSAHVVDAVSKTKGKIKAFDRYENEYILELVGGDTFYDVAVLKFKKGSETNQFQGLKFGKATEKLKVIAAGGSIGNVKGTILKEVVFPDSEKFISKHNNYLKSSTKVTRGYSGGPLCTIESEVVGINICRNKTHEAAYALKSQYAEKHIKQIIINGRVNRAFLGFEWKQSKFENKSPTIANVLPNSPASTYKKYVGYELVKINKYPITSIFEALQRFEQLTPNQKITLTLSKKGVNTTITLVTKILDIKALENIATYTFLNHSKYYIKSFSKKETTYVKSTIYHLKKGSKITKYDRLDIIQSVGIGEWSRMYQIIDLKDIGITIRLCSIFGEPIAVRSKKQNTTAVPIQPKKFKLYDDENSHRVLYF
ncbi:MAG: S1C family serine protease [Saprospiraceae bacterium]